MLFTTRFGLRYRIASACKLLASMGAMRIAQILSGWLVTCAVLRSTVIPAYVQSRSGGIAYNPHTLLVRSSGMALRGKRLKGGVIV